MADHGAYVGMQVLQAAARRSCASTRNAARPASFSTPNAWGRAAQGLDAAAGTPEAFRKLMADEIARWKKLVQAANIKAE